MLLLSRRSVHVYSSNSIRFESWLVFFARTLPTAKLLLILCVATRLKFLLPLKAFCPSSCIQQFPSSRIATPRNGNCRTNKRRQTSGRKSQPLLSLAPVLARSLRQCPRPVVQLRSHQMLIRCRFAFWNTATTKICV